MDYYANQTGYTPDAEWEQNLKWGVIARAATKDKNMDFRDKLNPAYPDEYAQIHGAGGKHHAVVSTIGLYITDKSGGQTKTVSANIPVEDMFMLYEVAKAKALSSGGGQKASVQTIQTQLAVLSQIRNGISGFVAPQAISDIDQVAANISAAAASLGCDDSWEHAPIKKINPYNAMKNAAGEDIGDVTEVAIRYQPVYNGRISKYPWYIEILNGKAVIQWAENGTTTYDSKKIENTQKVFINLSVDGFFRCVSRVVRYIELWEQQNVGPMIAVGTQGRTYLKTNGAAGYMNEVFRSECLAADAARKEKQGS